MTEALDSAIPWVAKHTRKYIETDGKEGHIWNNLPTLVLTTTGRRSGQPRRNALIYGRDGDAFVLVASYGGRPKHPLWYENLVADPSVQIQVGAEKPSGTARTVAREERARLWAEMARILPNYDDYQAKTEREIPVVVVEPD